MIVFTTICSFHILIRFSMSICVTFFEKKVNQRNFNNGFLRILELNRSLVGPSGLEPPTSCLSGTRSNLLSYEPMWLVSDFSVT